MTPWRSSLTSSLGSLLAALTLQGCSVCTWSFEPRPECAKCPKGMVSDTAAGAPECACVRVSCCDERTAACEACRQGVSVADFCAARRHGRTEGCQKDAHKCCKERKAECLACVRGISTAKLCGERQHRSLPGCGQAGDRCCDPGAGSDCKPGVDFPRCAKGLTCVFQGEEVGPPACVETRARDDSDSDAWSDENNDASSDAKDDATAEKGHDDDSAIDIDIDDDQEKFIAADGLTSFKRLAPVTLLAIMAAFAAVIGIGIAIVARRYQPVRHVHEHITQAEQFLEEDGQDDA
eukprot:TRINITY_DN66963_c0_g1_i1.p1 TRINITY_DN66963_c0_g1~~TRINITY_DN66963_c0_g1_i1.p1  ORF type:complete len:293 (-),score=46.74 TRINITY_DN66963_c0_g1_i1:145-1023(-)